MSPTTLPSGCCLCGKESGLFKCDQCELVPYCSSEHRILHLPWHKNTCMAIKRSCIHLEQTKEALINDGYVLPIATNQVSAWAPQYIEARLDLIKAMAEIKHVESVQAQLNHSMDMFESCGPEFAGLWEGIPALMARLHKDQECYDFVKWWHTVRASSGNINALSRLMSCKIKNADPFERLDNFGAGFVNSSYMIVLTLLKVKFLLDLRRIDQVVFALGATFPREILDLILSFVPWSPVVAANRRALDDEVRSELIYELEEQANSLFEQLQRRAPVLWRKFVCQKDDLDAMYSESPTPRYMVERVNKYLTLTHTAWIETPGAIDILNSKLVNTIRS
ncbi:hypothetical protein BDV32DRAFT_147725 [Aspergillus pseudonomiae]|nr:hypothetical protein BDV32DRAFT_147725 [Aspergillus pseudonomiae]